MPNFREDYNKYFGSITEKANEVLETNTYISRGDEEKANSVKLFDSDWMNGCLVAPLEYIERYKNKVLMQRAFFKFKSTRLGGNTAVNMPPGNGYLADPYVDAGIALTGVKTKSKYNVLDGVSYGACYKSIGLGRWYSENIDDYTQHVIFQFGVPEFNSIFSFLANSCSFIDTYIARTGVYPTWMDGAKKAATLVRVVAMPMLSLIAWSLNLGYTLITGNKPFSYYFLKPTMNLYWSMVNDISNYFAVKLGLTQYTVDKKGDEEIDKDRKGDGKKKRIVEGYAYNMSKTSKEIIQALYGGEKSPITGEWISGDKNYIDVHDIVTRRNFVFNEMKRKFYEEAMKVKDKEEEIDKVGEFDFSKETSYEEVTDFIAKTIMSTDAVNNFYGARDTGMKEIGEELKLIGPDGDNSADKGLGIPRPTTDPDGTSNKEKQDKGKDEASQKQTKDASTTSSAGGYSFTSVSGIESIDDDPDNKPKNQSSWDYIKYKIAGAMANFADAFSISARGYSSRAIFAVNPTGSTSDSFTNSTSSIGTGDQVKSLSRAAHDYRFNLAGGKTGLTNIDEILDKVYQVGAGLIEGASFEVSNIVNGLFFGGGYADVPDKWEDSSFSGSSVTYTMDLVSPYGNDYSRFHNLYVPLAMILAGALPRSVGKAGYIQPFNCSCYCKGAQNVSTGIITDVTVTSGITNQQFVLGMKTNSLRVTFTVKDLSNIVAARVNGSTAFGAYKPTFEDDTPIARWINKLTSVNYDDLAFVVGRLKTNLKMFGNSISSVYSAARLGHNLGNIFFEVDPIFYKNPNYNGFGRLS